MNILKAGQSVSELECFVGKWFVQINQLTHAPELFFKVTRVIDPEISPELSTIPVLYSNQILTSKFERPRYFTELYLAPDPTHVRIVPATDPKRLDTVWISATPEPIPETINKEKAFTNRSANRELVRPSIGKWFRVFGNSDEEFWYCKVIGLSKQFSWSDMLAVIGLCVQPDLSIQTDWSVPDFPAPVLGIRAWPVEPQGPRAILFTLPKPQTPYPVSLKEPEEITDPELLSSLERVQDACCKEWPNFIDQLRAQIDVNV